MDRLMMKQDFPKSYNYLKYQSEYQFERFTAFLNLVNVDDDKMMKSAFVRMTDIPKKPKYLNFSFIVALISFPFPLLIVVLFSYLITGKEVTILSEMDEFLRLLIVTFIIMMSIPFLIWMMKYARNEEFAELYIDDTSFYSNKNLLSENSFLDYEGLEKNKYYMNFKQEVRSYKLTLL